MDCDLTLLKPSEMLKLGLKPVQEVSNLDGIGSLIQTANDVNYINYNLLELGKTGNYDHFRV